jgi:hypothetical protein
LVGVRIQSGGLAVAGATNLAFLMDDTRSGLKDGDVGVSTAWLGTWIERQRRNLSEDEAWDMAGTWKPRKQTVSNRAMGLDTAISSSRLYLR